MMTIWIVVGRSGYYSEEMWVVAAYAHERVAVLRSCELQELADRLHNRLVRENEKLGCDKTGTEPLREADPRVVVNDHIGYSVHKTELGSNT